MLKLYNSKTNALEEFNPIVANKVLIYVCGPTVYNEIHIGNARPVVVFDVLSRYFILKGFEVTFISNYTDIDDKIIDKAIAENVLESEISEKYIKAFEANIMKLNCLKASFRPKVTDYLEEIKQTIEKLIDEGFAYKSGEDVYFAVEKIADYGNLSNQNLEQLRSGNRIAVAVEKENPLDFTLWKSTKKGIVYDAAFGKGRPGWHTECVVMIKSLTDGMVDIHAGGHDLLFPHHENEEAQSRAIDGCSLANYWLHNGMLMLEDLKMSKSLGNIILAKDLLDKYGGNVIRLSLLQTNYRQVLNYRQDLLEDCVKLDNKLESVFRELSRYVQIFGDNSSKNYEFLKLYENDMNTSNVITHLLQLVKDINKELRNKSDISVYYQEFNDILFLLGLYYEYPTLSEDDKVLYLAWEEARDAKNYDLADELRNSLQEKELL